MKSRFSLVLGVLVLCSALLGSCDLLGPLLDSAHELRGTWVIDVAASNQVSPNAIDPSYYEVKFSEDDSFLITDTNSTIIETGTLRSSTITENSFTYSFRNTLFNMSGERYATWSVSDAVLTWKVYENATRTLHFVTIIARRP